MKLFVDTSVWSLALRRNSSEGPEVERLRDALIDGESICTTGLVLQELLQGIRGPKAPALVSERFAATDWVSPTRVDHIEAANIRNACRRRGVQVGTIDALLARLCISRNLTMLTTDRDFEHVAEMTPLKVWSATRNGGLPNRRTRQ